MYIACMHVRERDRKKDECDGSPTLTFSADEPRSVGRAVSFGNGNSRQPTLHWPLESSA
jgi:hypothetical protein